VAYVKKITEFFDLHLKNVPQLHLVDAGVADKNEEEIKQAETPGQEGWQAAS